MSAIVSTKMLLDQLNDLRAKRNQPALKSWKGSRTALEQTIAAYLTKKVEPAIAEGAYPNANVAEHATGLKGKDERARAQVAKAIARQSHEEEGAKIAEAVRNNSTSTKESKMSKKPSMLKQVENMKAKGAKIVAASRKASDLVSLADIARELKIEPKLARAKARRSDDLTKLAQGDSWSFKPADVAKVKSILKGK